METVSLHFEGPFFWRTDMGMRCIFSAPEGRHANTALHEEQLDML